MLVRLESVSLRELPFLQTSRSGLVTLEMTPTLVKLLSSSHCQGSVFPIDILSVDTSLVVLGHWGM